MNKINELEGSLLAEYSQPSEYFYNEDYDFYPIMYEPYEKTSRPNYSQAYLHSRGSRPERRVMNGKVRKC
jgi:hypothetical protein